MAKYQRIKGGEKNEKTGVDWTRSELEKVCDLYIILDGKNIHENNPEIHKLAHELGRTIRSVENQLLGFRKVATKETGRKNYNRLIPLIWNKKTQDQTKKDPSTDVFKFRISSALKDIIGQDLITDDYIAVFELVKNSYDAFATRVDIYFLNIYSDNGKIIIKDNGKGMDEDDIKNKWLVVAYSAKKDGTEDLNHDYRKNIYKNRVYAGAKGIGRFSCDKLGRKLYIESTKKHPSAKTQALYIDWGKFEESFDVDFVDIGIEHKQKTKNSFNLNNGTVLEISELRSFWDRNKQLTLKNSLAKLINPNRGKGEQSFKIFIHSEEEKENDKRENDLRKKINGEVKNFIFETLGLKTTKISASISENGKYIRTELVEGGSLIYRITETNNYDLLDNVEYTLYYLNQSAKRAFHLAMGVSSKDYGHVFLYKNGFRVYPYGEPGEDPLRIDVRKAQGVRRHLGTRELIGQIEVFSDTDQLKETSSRGDGLLKTDTYSQLMECFWDVLKRLERYVVDVQKWGLSIESDENKKVKERITELIAKLSNSSSILEFEYPDNFIEILEASQAESADRVVKNLKRIAIESGNNQFLKQVEKANSVLNEIRKAKEEAEKELENERLKADQTSKELEEKVSENLFLKSIKSQDLDAVVSFMHSIGISASTIDNYLSSTYKKISRNIPIQDENLKEIIRLISLENRKVLSISRFGTKANFKLYAEESFIDIVEYISEYAINILSPLRREDIEIFVENKEEIVFFRNIRPIELSIVLDNFLNNSIRASATKFSIKFSTDDNYSLMIKIQDNGKGIPDENLDKIFEFGFTTTSGSGLGLFHVKEILDKMSCNLSVNNKIKKGVEFILKFR